MQDVLHPSSCVRGDCGRRAHVEGVLLNLDLRLGATPWLDSAGSAPTSGDLTVHCPQLSNQPELVEESRWSEYY